MLVVLRENIELRRKLLLPIPQHPSFYNNGKNHQRKKILLGDVCHETTALQKKRGRSVEVCLGNHVPFNRHYDCPLKAQFGPYSCLMAIGQETATDSVLVELTIELLKIATIDYSTGIA